MIIKRYAAALAALWCLYSFSLTPEIIAQTKKADATAKKTDGRISVKTSFFPS